ncbi:nucleoside triphosphate pyrophosphohydrolase [Komagataeibacter saccharivorans]|uniref:Nucleoside triphosphate pyrophosphohydrolase n=1 Tax=Komagataeibacter saccharivorans TaxID=265959 RepID=A0A347W953_9PROT|nr:nucleoside triphosphate pyrophosphohydrolase [Komagataeibacter saccharivorans]AXY21396.1 Nucleoside triphosphate pyrophosphohydrolase [Komagataeibacter saccharivorans]PYD51542.1 nucleoside triphosphate pyrophosphohydrolase [Komagataeibacter saccharivorans]QBL94705.1 Nucleoside triphosphate pyrophosphohydrolase [Komagataeibacter saccharivorans]GBQ42405.1 nucleotide pyrophosphohydrolase MazG [Komagataeibacter saccharivorans NRIC 0614]
MHDAPTALQRLLDIMARLRDPQTGCPWDKAQNFATIAPYSIEEAYEVADTIAREDWDSLPDELGDLLLQVVYHAQMADEQGLFDFATVARMIGDKMVRRHPHVFGDTPASAGQWENGKAQERLARNRGGTLDDVPVGLPALLRARKLSARAARTGFDWDTVGEVAAKVDEELDELKVELESGDREKIFDELGDVLFTLATLARKLDMDPEACLRQANAKFTRRFTAMEHDIMARGLSLGDVDVKTMEEGWQAVKRRERADMMPES